MQMKPFTDKDLADIDNKILSAESKLSLLHEQRREIINQMNKNKESKQGKWKKPSARGLKQGVKQMNNGDK